MCQPPNRRPGLGPTPDDDDRRENGSMDRRGAHALPPRPRALDKWTKVADVVGSRTTVQVRSHAQKYFQKLEKDRAQPSGSGGRGRAGAGFGGRQFGDYDGLDEGAAPIAAPLALRKFLPAGTGQNGHAGPADVAAGLFKFLSPLALPSKPDKVNEMARTIFDDPAADLHHQQLEARSRPAPPPTVPEWYRRGGRLDELRGRGPDRVEGRFWRRTFEGPAAARVSGTTAPETLSAAAVGAVGAPAGQATAGRGGPGAHRDGN